MKWATYLAEDHTERVGLVVDQQIFGLGPGIQLIDLLGDLASAGRRAETSPVEVRPLPETRLRPPIPRPPAIRVFSSFQDDHQAGIKAIGQKWDDAWFEVPFFYFSKPPTTLGDGDVFMKPPNSNQMDYELE